MADKLTTLLETVTEREKIELTILNNAVVETVKAYNLQPTAQHKRNWDSAQNGLDRKIEQLWANYFNEEPAFKNIMEVVTHLQKQGFRVKKSKVYKDARAGLLKVQKDGRVVKNDVIAYSTTLEKLPEDHGRAEERTVERLGKDIELKDARIRSLLFELEKKMGEHIPRRDVEMEIVARVAVLESGLRHWIQAYAGEMIFMCEGDPNKTGDIIRRGNEMLDSLLNDFANTEKFQVLFINDEPVAQH